LIIYGRTDGNAGVGNLDVRFRVILNVRFRVLLDILLDLILDVRFRVCLFRFYFGLRLTLTLNLGFRFGFRFRFRIFSGADWAPRCAHDLPLRIAAF